MLITKKFLDDTGRRSLIARAAMVQAGDKNRIKALKNFLISVGACEMTFDDAKTLNLPLCKKQYSFLTSPMTFVLLDAANFKRFKPLKNGVALEIAHARNGLIGIQRKQETHA
jgi:hypothetical protein